MEKINRSEEKWQALFRSTLIKNEDPDRFRQAFYQVLAAQDNVAFRMFENEIRQLKFELPAIDLYSQLKKYLSSGDWQKADAETAWLFYWTMLKQDYPNWFQLFQSSQLRGYKDVLEITLVNQ